MFTRTPHRTVRGICLALAIALTLAAGALPACGGMCCPLQPEAPTLHAEMPCCATQPAFAPQDAVRLQPAMVAGLRSIPQGWAPDVLVERSFTTVTSSPRVQTTLDTASLTLREPAPPLFLLNSQFLI